MSNPLKLTINGERHTFCQDQEEPLTIAGLLVKLGLDPLKLAVEHNHEIVRRSTYDDVTVHDGDNLELVQFVGGG
ncbi:MAG: sulfur carrier protein ThiS [Alphaproteobacteria bacterium]|nr:thiamine biosynthesis protein ThiS [Rhodobiaceae bacterium]MBO6541927.1 sulfur carrier protein ThiS [Alphaproteobacteria bacterium]MBO6628097.1 sulfur carrier protein ThiS [Alphaproteobacteria bacterium]MDF1625217.1 sulfur carrier protein ThiS [Parvibaculaceae bacterium]